MDEFLNLNYMYLCLFFEQHIITCAYSDVSFESFVDDYVRKLAIKIKKI